MSTIGIIHPGELGSALGRHLAESGHPVIVTLEGRSLRTAKLAAEAGFSVLPTLASVLSEADVVFAVVPPQNALELAKRAASLIEGSKPRVYVDLASVGPATTLEISAVLKAKSISFVDGAVHGCASRLTTSGAIYLSGTEADGIADLLGKGVRTIVLGSSPGQASALKMLISGISKGVCALFVEMGSGAMHYGCSDELASALDRAYPGLMELVRRMLPTFALHAERRAAEMGQLSDTLRDAGIEPRMAESARSIIEEMARSYLARGEIHETDRTLSLSEILSRIVTQPGACQTASARSGEAARMLQAP